MITILIIISGSTHSMWLFQDIYVSTEWNLSVKIQVWMNVFVVISGGMYVPDVFSIIIMEKGSWEKCNACIVEIA